MTMIDHHHSLYNGHVCCREQGALQTLKLANQALVNVCCAAKHAALEGME